MNIITIVRRAFGVNPRSIPVAAGEAATLEASGIRQDTIRSYLAWRRSLMIFVVLATLCSAGLATYRERTEPDESFDIWSAVVEQVPGLSDAEEEEDESASEEDDDEDDEEGTAATGADKDEDEEEVDPETAFGRFVENVELAALYILPAAALLVVLFWTRVQLTFLILVGAFGLSFVIPVLIALCPWSWWGYVEPNYDRHTQPLQYFEDMAEGLFEAVVYLATLLPTVISLVPGVQRACIRVKFLLPQSMLPGWFLVTASPFYALFLLVVFIAILQFDSHPLFLAGLLLFLSAPMLYVARSALFTKPLTSADDERRIRLVQKFIGLTTALGGAMIVGFLTTREFGDVRLLGTDPEKSILLPLDIVEFLLETISKSMFMTVLGADLFMRLNLSAWKNARDFADTAAAADYDRVMGEFERIS